MSIRDNVKKHLDSKDFGDMSKIELAMLFELERLQGIDKQLIESTSYLIRELTRTVEGVKEPGSYSVNSLGAVQDKGREIDRLCALRAAKEEELATLIRLCQ